MSQLHSLGSGGRILISLTIELNDVALHTDDGIIQVDKAVSKAVYAESRVVTHVDTVGQASAEGIDRILVLLDSILNVVDDTVGGVYTRIGIVNSLLAEAESAVSRFLIFPLQISNILSVGRDLAFELFHTLFQFVTLLTAVRLCRLELSHLTIESLQKRLVALDIFLPTLHPHRNPYRTRAILIRLKQDLSEE